MNINSSFFQDITLKIYRIHRSRKVYFSKYNLLLRRLENLDPSEYRPTYLQYNFLFFAGFIVSSRL